MQALFYNTFETAKFIIFKANYAWRFRHLRRELNTPSYLQKDGKFRQLPLTAYDDITFGKRWMLGAFRRADAVRRGGPLPADKPAVPTASTRVGGTGATGRRRSCVAPGYRRGGGENRAGWAVLVSTPKLVRHGGLRPDRVVVGGGWAGCCGALLLLLLGRPACCCGCEHGPPVELGIRKRKKKINVKWPQQLNSALLYTYMTQFYFHILPRLR